MRLAGGSGAPGRRGASERCWPGTAAAVGDVPWPVAVAGFWRQGVVVSGGKSGTALPQSAGHGDLTGQGVCVLVAVFRSVK